MIASKPGLAAAVDGESCCAWRRVSSHPLQRTASVSHAGSPRPPLPPPYPPPPPPPPPSPPPETKANPWARIAWSPVHRPGGHRARHGRHANPAGMNGDAGVTAVWIE